LDTEANQTIKTTIKTVAILSQAERFELLAKGALLSGPKKFKKLESLQELYKFSEKSAIGTRLIIDLQYAPELTSENLRRLRSYGWNNILLVTPKKDSEQIKRICQERSEALLVMPSNPRLSTLAEKMTEREITIMQHLADGLKINAIAQVMHYSPTTVKRSMKEACQRTGYSKRITLLADLFRQGVIK
jgi:DNA-binding CsgD family transcriptional regulator